MHPYTSSSNCKLTLSDFPWRGGAGCATGVSQTLRLFNEIARPSKVEYQACKVIEFDTVFLSISQNRDLETAL